MERFGEALKRLRVARGLTQRRLSLKIGMSDTAISRWEDGTRHPQRQSVRLLVRALGLDGEERDRLYVAAGLLPPDVDPAVMLAACRAIRSEEAA